MNMNEQTIAGLCASIDTMDPSKFVEFLDEDAVFRFGNGDPVCGRTAVREYVAHFFTNIQSIRHVPLRVHHAGDFTIVEMQVSYVDQWGRPLSVPVCVVMRSAKGKIDEYFIYTDNHELFVTPAGAPSPD
jgi:ketosteroid isomerase-like protein